MATKKKKKKKKQKKAAKVASKKAAPKKKPAAKKAPAKKAAAKKKAARKEDTLRAENRGAAAVPFEAGRLRARSMRASPEDLHGRAGIEGADSESVDELLEEGNAFEAEVVKGVEDAEADVEGEVRTHEVPEDDVPQEYLDDEQ